MDAPRRRLIPPNRLKSEKGIDFSADSRRRLEANGGFPLRIPLSHSRHAYDEGEIDQWIADRMAKR